MVTMIVMMMTVTVIAIFNIHDNVFKLNIKQEINETEEEGKRIFFSPKTEKSHKNGIAGKTFSV